MNNITLEMYFKPEVLKIWLTHNTFRCTDTEIDGI